MDDVKVPRSNKPFLVTGRQPYAHVVSQLWTVCSIVVWLKATADRSRRTHKQLPASRCWRDGPAWRDGGMAGWRDGGMSSLQRLRLSLSKRTRERMATCLLGPCTSKGQPQALQPKDPSPDPSLAGDIPNHSSRQRAALVVMVRTQLFS